MLIKRSVVNTIVRSRLYSQWRPTEGSVILGSKAFANREHTLEEIYMRKIDQERIEELRKQLKEKEKEYKEKWCEYPNCQSGKHEPLD